MNRRPGFLVYGLLIAFVLGSAAPFYWSFLLGSHTAAIAAQGTPPLLPGGHFIDNAQRVFDTVPFWKALANSLLVSTSPRPRSCASRRWPATRSPSSGSAATSR